MKTVNRDSLAKRIRKLRSENVAIKSQADYWQYQAKTAQTVLGLARKDNAERNARLAYINKLTIGPWLESGVRDVRSSC